MGKLLIFCSLLVFLFAFLTKYLYDLGAFRQIQRIGSDHCRLLQPDGGKLFAFEDLATDYERGLIYAPGDDRLWWSSFKIWNGMKTKQGKVYAFHIDSEHFDDLPLTEYPYEHFHPLGVDLFKGKIDQLFIVNYRTDQEQIIGTVEIFQVDSEKNGQLKWMESVVHPLFTAPDDVLIINEKTFYVTNVYHYRKDQSVFMHQFELLAKRPWTNMLLCSKTDQWQCEIVVDSVLVANGLAASRDLTTVYMAASAEKQIRVFNRNPINGSLTWVNSLAVPFLIDNIVVDDQDRLTAAGHPKGLSLLSHESNPQNRAPSEAIIFSQPRTNSTYEHLIENEGDLMSAITVAVPYKNKLLFGALFDSGILVC